MPVCFSEEIIHKILLKLPVESLIRFTLVCKSWTSLIKSSAFIQSHLRTTIDSNEHNNTHLVLLSATSYNRTHYDHHWLHWDTPEFSEHSTLSSPNVLKKKLDFGMGVVGISNGLVCLAANMVYRDHHTPTLIWNPCIRKVVMLPKPPVCFKYTKHKKDCSHAFGYDAHSKDYKILRVVTLLDDHSDLSRFATKVQVYSLARGSWKRLSKSVIPVDLQSDADSSAFVNGSFHMLQGRLSVYYNDNYEEDQKCGGDGFISTFNLATEEFGEMMEPKGLLGRCSIARYGDSLALIEHHDYHRDDVVNRGCDIWVMKEYGDAESWTYLFNIHVVQANIYGFKRCGEVVLVENNQHGRRTMYSFDPETNQLKFSGRRTEEYNYYSYQSMDSFVESLVLLDHANAISDQVARKKKVGRQVDNDELSFSKGNFGIEL